MGSNRPYWKCDDHHYMSMALCSIIFFMLGIYGPKLADVWPTYSLVGLLHQSCG